MKTIVTHISPDTDALTSIWLIRKFLPGWSESVVQFVPAGATLDKKPPDENPDIIHVDTGLGKFDHHQNNANTCAAKKVFEFINAEVSLKSNFSEALERMVDIINDFDHFREVFLTDPDQDVYDFLIIGIIDGMRLNLQDDLKLVEISGFIFDGILQTFLNKVRAEEQLDKGLIFESRWGKTLAVESESEDVSRIAQKRGFNMVIRKSRKRGYLKIKTRPEPKLNLKKLHEILVKKDPAATWFYHASGHILLNGSTKNPDMKPTTLTLPQVVDIVKNIR